MLVYVDVADIDAAIARAKELNAPLYLEKTEIPTVGWMAVIGDPGGNRIAVMEAMRTESESASDASLILVIHVQQFQV